MSEYTVRSTDPQITVNGRTFAVRHVLLGGMFDAINLLEKVGNDWINVGDSAAPMATEADFSTEENVIAWLHRLCVWIMAQFARIFGSIPPDKTPVLGEGGKMDLAIQGRIKLNLVNGSVTATVV